MPLSRERLVDGLLQRQRSTLLPQDLKCGLAELRSQRRNCSVCIRLVPLGAHAAGSLCQRLHGPEQASGFLRMSLHRSHASEKDNHFGKQTLLPHFAAEEQAFASERESTFCIALRKCNLAKIHQCVTDALMIPQLTHGRQALLK